MTPEEMQTFLDLKKKEYYNLHPNEHALVYASLFGYMSHALVSLVDTDYKKQVTLQVFKSELNRLIEEQNAA